MLSSFVFSNTYIANRTRIVREGKILATNMAPPPELNVGVPDLEYFTPQHVTSPGTPAASETTKSVPKLFQPLTIRGTTLRNRILVAPMCQYSTASHGPATGALTDYHIATLGHYALKGAALVMVRFTLRSPKPTC